MKLGRVGTMLHVGPSFVLYALLLDPGWCPRAHFELDGQFVSEKKRPTVDVVCSPISHSNFVIAVWQGD